MPKKKICDQISCEICKLGAQKIYMYTLTAVWDGFKSRWLHWNNISNRLDFCLCQERHHVLFVAFPSSERRQQNICRNCEKFYHSHFPAIWQQKAADLRFAPLWIFFTLPIHFKLNFYALHEINFVGINTEFHWKLSLWHPHKTLNCKAILLK